jgi:hypothetical protein
LQLHPHSRSTVAEEATAAAAAAATPRWAGAATLDFLEDTQDSQAVAVASVAERDSPGAARASPVDTRAAAPASAVDTRAAAPASAVDTRVAAPASAGRQASRHEAATQDIAVVSRADT